MNIGWDKNTPLLSNEKMKKIIIIIAILVLGVFGYSYWINTPQYSLMQIQKSIDTKDKFLFDKYVDTNEIIEEMDAQESYEYSFLDPQVLTAGLVSLFQPAIENAIEEGFE